MHGLDYIIRKQDTPPSRKDRAVAQDLVARVVSDSLAPMADDMAYLRGSCHRRLSLAELRPRINCICSTACEGVTVTHTRISAPYSSGRNVDGHDYTVPCT